VLNVDLAAGGDVLMGVKTLGAAMVWECTQCGERHVGVLGDKQTRTWQDFHNNHVQSGRGVWYDPKDD